MNRFVDVDFGGSGHQDLKLLARSAEFDKYRCNSNYLKGVKWSPDGTCLLSTSADKVARVFMLPYELYSPDYVPSDVIELKSAAQQKESETINDFCWYPMTNLSSPGTACFVATSKGSPIHLWDACKTGYLRGSYFAYDHLEQLLNVYSLSFSNDGSLLFCGLENCIKTFDTSRPGRTCTTLPTHTRKGESTLKGIISTIAASPDCTLLAAGGYSSTVAAYSTSDSSCVCSFASGHKNGVTQVKFSPDGKYLVSGARKDSELRVWDLRNTGAPVHRFKRPGTTNQRITFDFSSTGRYIISGSSTVPGEILAFPLYGSDCGCDDAGKLLQACQCSCADEVIRDCVNSVSVHKSLPLVAVGSGQRKLPLVCRRFNVEEENDDSDGSNSENEDDKKDHPAPASDNMLRIMKLPFNWKEF